jgi:DNA repair protein RecO (recombination protein O)
MEQITPAILLRKTPWSETSLIVTWLTSEFGAIRTLARGARGPRSAFAGKLDLFFGGDISFVHSRKGDLHTLREVHIVSVFDAAKSGHAGFHLAAYFAELAGRAAPAMHPARELHDLLRRALDFLQTSPATERALNHFERELCRILGVHDASGKISAAEALHSLQGGAPKSRAAALKFISP